MKSVHSSDVFILSWSHETSESISMKLCIPVGDSAPDFVGQIWLWVASVRYEDQIQFLKFSEEVLPIQSDCIS